MLGRLCVGVHTLDTLKLKAVVKKLSNGPESSQG